MSFLRPEINQWWDRWKEVSMLWIASLMSIYFALTSVSLSYFLIFIALAILLFLVGIGAYRAARLKGDGVAFGHVEVDERRVTYFLGGEGFAVAIDELEQVALQSQKHKTRGTELHWVLSDKSGSMLKIPTAAPGAENLFENLSVLQGISYQDALEVVRGQGDQKRVIWQAD